MRFQVLGVGNQLIGHRIFLIDCLRRVIIERRKTPQKLASQPSKINLPVYKAKASRNTLPPFNSLAKAAKQEQLHPIKQMLQYLTQ